MSVQAGIWNWDGEPVSQEWISRLDGQIAEYGPDRLSAHLAGSIAFVYRAFITTPEATAERQPWIGPTGNIITWDGRLDNRNDLQAQLGLGFHSSDIEIVGAAFEKWDLKSFGRLIGDWAMTIWQPSTRTLFLSTDFSGLRHLYYYASCKRAFWCTLLSPIVVLSNSRFTLDECYVAGYISSYPAVNVTPYKEIRPVKAGHYVAIQAKNITSNRFWKLSPERKTFYKTDTEYEEHFRHVLKQSVQRRLRSSAPILADLSGGLDSSSIVCMADAISSDEQSASVAIHTLSFYDVKEPLGDEREYIQIVEQKRGRRGHHIDLEPYSHSVCLESGHFSAAPCFPMNGKFVDDFQKLVNQHGYRVFLSGYGGDELLGGVPDPRFQLADLLFKMQWFSFWKQLFAWSIAKKVPWVKLCSDSLRVLGRTAFRKTLAPQPRLAAWINGPFVRERAVSDDLHEMQSDFRLSLPTRREYATSIALMIQAIAHSPGQHLPCEERRYPYLDRDLIEFLVSIPSTQLLRPGQRRSLMRRSLKGLVPTEILWRKTKGATGRRHLLALQSTITQIARLMDSPISGQMGFIDSCRFREDMSQIAAGHAMNVVPMLKEISLEFWLQNLIRRGLISHSIGSSGDSANATLTFHSSAVSQE